MVGRRANRRLSGHAPAAPVEPACCTLCERPLGRRVELHHLVPKSEGGRETVALHPICHRAIHAAIDNKTLARETRTSGELRARPELAAFLRWIADKPADFQAATRRATGNSAPRRR